MEATCFQIGSVIHTRWCCCWSCFYLAFIFFFGNLPLAYAHYFGTLCVCVCMEQVWITVGALTHMNNGHQASRRYIFNIQYQYHTPDFNHKMSLHLDCQFIYLLFSFDICIYVERTHYIRALTHQAPTETGAKSTNTESRKLLIFYKPTAVYFVPFFAARNLTL